MELGRKILFIIPFVLLYLGITNTFNIFKMDEYTSGELVEVKKDQSGDTVEDDLKADTRTFIYVDVLNTALKYNYWWFGRSPARGNESDIFGKDDMNGRNERLGNEVGILNVFTWTGIIGVICYFLVFYQASYLAINKSNNIFSKMLGIFVAFRWVYAWVEDVNDFTLTTYLLWVMLGLCLAPTFRNLTDQEVKIWIRGIFDNRYRELEYFLYMKKVE